MGLQIIICVEADKRSRTDNNYINQTLRHYYEITNDININYINMGGKSKYNSREVSKKINELSSDYKLGETSVVYCIDTDSFETNNTQKKELDDITAFAEKNGYDLVLFCHDVEEVYWGQHVHDDNKKDTAVRFVKNKEICNVDPKRLMSDKLSKCHSNVLNIFDKYLKRKRR